ncbi:hypothetical protein ACLOJK_023005 [Asimina triloba]
MAQEGFDFNACIYNGEHQYGVWEVLLGISYLSRAQESSAKDRIKNPIPSVCTVKSSSTPSVADSIFMQRIKSRIRHWKDTCNDSKKTTEEALVRSLRKLILGGEIYGSRPCLNIDVSNERQVQLIVEEGSSQEDKKGRKGIQLRVMRRKRKDPLTKMRREEREQE